MDPLLTIDGRPYAPQRIAEIVEERYLISKHIHTSYNDIGDITPLEREYLLKYIKRDLDQQNEAYRKLADQSRK